MKHLNKKKKKRLWAEYSHSTIYFAFMLSLILHTIVIYSIPAVNVFSEGPDSSFEPIEVDFFQTDSPESLTEISQSESDQFQTDIPLPDDPLPVDQPADTVTTEPESERSDLEMMIPRVEEQLSSKHDVFLLSQVTERKPDLSLPAKQALSPLPVHNQPLISKQPPLEKIVMTPPPHPLQIQPPRAMNEHAPIAMKISPNKRLPQQDSREQGISLPLRPPQQEKSLSMAVQNVAESPFHPGKPQATEPTKESPALEFARRDITTFSQKRQFGIVKEKENDTNQFGIFAGRKFDDPPVKDVIEEAIPNNQITPPQPEETEHAPTLSAESQIDGPIRGRAIIRRPQPPQVNVGIEVELRLKFWVLPDGTIGEVVPIKRGDAQLERIAITYLKQWRFEPLAPGVPQEKIWGTIPIRFTVQ